MLRVPGNAVRGKPVSSSLIIVKFYTIYTPVEMSENLAYYGFWIKKIGSHDQKLWPKIQKKLPIFLKIPLYLFKNHYKNFQKQLISCKLDTGYRMV